MRRLQEKRGNSSSSRSKSTSTRSSSYSYRDSTCQDQNASKITNNKPGKQDNKAQDLPEEKCKHMEQQANDEQADLVLVVDFRSAGVVVVVVMVVDDWLAWQLSPVSLAGYEAGILAQISKLSPEQEQQQYDNYDHDHDHDHNQALATGQYQATSSSSSSSSRKINTTTAGKNKKAKIVARHLQRRCLLPFRCATFDACVLQLGNISYIDNINYSLLQPASSCKFAPQNLAAKQANQQQQYLQQLGDVAQLLAEAARVSQLKAKIIISALVVGDKCNCKCLDATNSPIVAEQQQTSQKIGDSYLAKRKTSCVMKNDNKLKASAVEAKNFQAHEQSQQFTEQASRQESNKDNKQDLVDETFESAARVVRQVRLATHTSVVSPLRNAFQQIRAKYLRHAPSSLQSSTTIGKPMQVSTTTTTTMTTTLPPTSTQLDCTSSLQPASSAPAKSQDASHKAAADVSLVSAYERLQLSIDDEVHSDLDDDDDDDLADNYSTTSGWTAPTNSQSTSNTDNTADARRLPAADDIETAHKSKVYDNSQQLTQQTSSQTNHTPNTNLMMSSRQQQHQQHQQQQRALRARVPQHQATPAQYASTRATPPHGTKHTWAESATFSSSLTSCEHSAAFEKDSSRRTSTLSGISSICQQEASLGTLNTPSLSDMGSIPELFYTSTQNGLQLFPRASLDSAAGLPACARDEHDAFSQHLTARLRHALLAAVPTQPGGNVGGAGDELSARGNVATRAANAGVSGQSSRACRQRNVSMSMVTGLATNATPARRLRAQTSMAADIGSMSGSPVPATSAMNLRRATKQTSVAHTGELNEEPVRQQKLGAKSGLLYEAGAASGCEQTKANASFVELNFNRVTQSLRRQISTMRLFGASIVSSGRRGSSSSQHAPPPAPPPSPFKCQLSSSSPDTIAMAEGVDNSAQATSARSSVLQPSTKKAHQQLYFDSALPSPSPTPTPSCATNSSVASDTPTPATLKSFFRSTSSVAFNALASGLQLKTTTTASSMAGGGLATSGGLAAAPTAQPASSLTDKATPTNNEHVSSVGATAPSDVTEPTALSLLPEAHLRQQHQQTASDSANLFARLRQTLHSAAATLNDVTATTASVLPMQQTTSLSSASSSMQRDDDYDHDHDQSSLAATTQTTATTTFAAANSTTDQATTTTTTTTTTSTTSNRKTSSPTSASDKLTATTTSGSSTNAAANNRFAASNAKRRQSTQVLPTSQSIALAHVAQQQQANYSMYSSPISNNNSQHPHQSGCEWRESTQPSIESTTSSVRSLRSCFFSMPDVRELNANNTDDSSAASACETDAYDLETSEPAAAAHDDDLDANNALLAAALNRLRLVASSVDTLDEARSRSPSPSPSPSPSHSPPEPLVRPKVPSSAHRARARSLAPQTAASLSTLASATTKAHQAASTNLTVPSINNNQQRRRRSTMSLAPGRDVPPAATTLNLRLGNRCRVKLRELHPVTFLADAPFLASLNSLRPASPAEPSSAKLEAIFNSPVGRRLSTQLPPTSLELATNGPSSPCGVKIGLDGNIVIQRPATTSPLELLMSSSLQTRKLVSARRTSLTPNFWSKPSAQSSPHDELNFNTNNHFKCQGQQSTGLRAPHANTERRRTLATLEKLTESSLELSDSLVASSSKFSLGSSSFERQKILENKSNDLQVDDEFEEQPRTTSADTTTSNTTTNSNTNTNEQQTTNSLADCDNDNNNDINSSSPTSSSSSDDGDLEKLVQRYGDSTTNNSNPTTTPTSSSNRVPPEIDAQNLLIVRQLLAATSSLQAQNKLATAKDMHLATQFAASTDKTNHVLNLYQRSDDLFVANSMRPRPGLHLSANSCLFNSSSLVQILNIEDQNSSKSIVTGHSGSSFAFKTPTIARHRRSRQVSGSHASRHSAASSKAKQSASESSTSSSSSMLPERHVKPEVIFTSNLQPQTELQKEPTKDKNNKTDNSNNNNTTSTSTSTSTTTTSDASDLNTNNNNKPLRPLTSASVLSVAEVDVEEQLERLRRQERARASGNNASQRRQVSAPSDFVSKSLALQDNNDNDSNNYSYNDNDNDNGFDETDTRYKKHSTSNKWIVAKSFDEQHFEQQQLDESASDDELLGQQNDEQLEDDKYNISTRPSDGDDLQQPQTVGSFGSSRLDTIVEATGACCEDDDLSLGVVLNLKLLKQHQEQQQQLQMICVACRRSTCSDEERRTITSSSPRAKVSEAVEQQTPWQKSSKRLAKDTSSSSSSDTSGPDEPNATSATDEEQEFEDNEFVECEQKHLRNTKGRIEGTRATQNARLDAETISGDVKLELVGGNDAHQTQKSCAKCGKPIKHKYERIEAIDLESHEKGTKVRRLLSERVCEIDKFGDNFDADDNDLEDKDEFGVDVLNSSDSSSVSSDEQQQLGEKDEFDRLKKQRKRSQKQTNNQSIYLASASKPVSMLQPQPQQQPTTSTSSQTTPTTKPTTTSQQQKCIARGASRKRSASSANVGGSSCITGSTNSNTTLPDATTNQQPMPSRRKNKWQIQRNLAPKLKRQRSFSANYAPEVPNPMMPPPRRFSAAPSLSCPQRATGSKSTSSSIHTAHSIDSSESMITVIPANRSPGPNGNASSSFDNFGTMRTSRGLTVSDTRQSLYSATPGSPRSPSQLSPGSITPTNLEFSVPRPSTSTDRFSEYDDDDKNFEEEELNELNENNDDDDDDMDDDHYSRGDNDDGCRDLNTANNSRTDMVVDRMESCSSNTQSFEHQHSGKKQLPKNLLPLDAIEVPTKVSAETLKTNLLCSKHCQLKLETILNRQSDLKICSDWEYSEENSTLSVVVEKVSTK